jgi:hypothetical protein
MLAFESGCAQVVTSETSKVVKSDEGLVGRSA